MTVGFAEERPRPRDGWKDASRNLEVVYRDHDRGEVSNEDTQMLVALMSIENVDLPPAYALEFLA